MTNDAEKAIMVDEARRRGYFEDPRVMHEVDIAMEELLTFIAEADNWQGAAGASGQGATK